MATISPESPAEILARYRAERDKRIDAKGNGQYVDAVGTLARFGDADPNAAPRIERDPITAEVEVLIVGAGFGGLLTAARLKEAGITDVRILDLASDFGGTWYWNRYPGVQCDIESYSYLPLLEETGYVAKHRYAYGDEIREYSQFLGRYFDLYPKASFQTRVTDVEWDAATQRWQVNTDRGDRFSARYFMLAVGRVSRPKLPGIPGIEKFRGHSFHTSRWDYGYTGGDTHADLDKLGDKRVAVIGTGATGIQLIPRVAKTAKHLTVFQRTPSSVGIRGNHATDVEWYKSQKPGWQEYRRSLFLDAASGLCDDSEIRDGWTETGRILREGKPAHPETPEEMGKRAMMADIQVMNGRRARIDETVKDRETAEKLKPWYNLFCKRPTFNDEFLDAFNRPNVTLVDASGDDAISEITETGVVAGGKDYPVDLIIYASGFQVIGTVGQRVTFPVKGRDGVMLEDHWGAGMRTLHGLTAHNFPNWFYIGQGQNAVAANYTTTVDDQAKHLAYILTEAKKRDATVIEPTAEAEQGWLDEIRASNKRPPEFYENCTPGYYNNEGKGGVTIWAESYAPGATAFNALLKTWRDAGDMKGLTLR
ncbi:flavin-containing monooxygenase [Sphingomonas montanisoli]|uniref:NAD(P)/FAD-dependent oxidoreductase n=1 Tax=Sphingomonas montanisoli TaxID=2606412 RepID=A0A5D9CCL0_9SPHN|nr:NAD(P)/FAD-dependent oxidoreductase [Sphingomonas montanisoli]TZG29424.1 NAD(P)/FAD-dependent oxidoreductase [Sphingomonas montanisoli]